MKSVVFPFVVIVASLVATSPAHAQAPWGFELRGGVSVPTETFAGADLETGAGLEGNISVHVAPLLGIYAGWDWQHRGAKAAVFGATDVEDTGYAFGVRLAASSTGRSPWVRVGALYEHVELEDESGESVADSEHTWGWELGGGIQLPIGGAWTITPGIRYRSFEPDVRVGSISTPATVSYVIADIGFAVRF